MKRDFPYENLTAWEVKVLFPGYTECFARITAHA
jgi:hypothetical protein